MTGRTSKKSRGKVSKPKKTVPGEQLEELKQELEEKGKKAQEYLDNLKYLQAEFDNYRKSVQKEKESTLKYAKEGLILQLLDVYESLDKAIKNGGEDTGSLIEGVEMIYGEFKKTLEREGLSEIEALGEKFDPFKHEALNVEEDDSKDPNTIVEEYQKGYMLGDKVIRYSKVKVIKR